MNTSSRDKAKLTVALCGNPNSGKTTLFNALTGENQKVGNWPGVTVQQRRGTYTADSRCQIVDTPGVYSLSPFTPDEQVAHDFLTKGSPDVIINVVDSTNLERSLFLTCQLVQLDVPVVVALNMQDEASQKGISVDAQTLAVAFGCKFFSISAAKRQGLDQLMQYCLSAPQKTQTPPPFSSEIETALTKISAVLPSAENVRHTALNLLQQDTPLPHAAAPLSPQQTEAVTNVRTQLNDSLPDGIGAAIAEMRYEFISRILEKAQHISAPSQKPTATQRIDKIVLNKWLAFPIFAVVMTLIFFVSIKLGGLATNVITQKLTPQLQIAFGGILKNAPDMLRRLVCDGIIAGVMSVVGFVPQIMLLFGFIAILEASGYMSRIAFITDRLLYKIGLGGRSFVSMILGCGCSVPAIMATRTIKNIDERNTTVTLTSFMPCSAKLAVIAFFTSYVFGGKALFAISFYLLSILAVIFGGLLLKTLRRNKQQTDAFIMELPTYRKPTLSNVWKQMWERGKAFLSKAGSVILVASVVLWILTNFGWDYSPATVENSILASVGKFIAPLFYPLGWNDGGCGWQLAISTLSGIAAKETVVTTLNILLPQGVCNCVSGIAAYSFVAYNLLTIPCVAAISASFSEQGAKRGLTAALFQIAFAYCTSACIYWTGWLKHNRPTVFAAILCCIAVAVSVAGAIARLANKKCAGLCKYCRHKNVCGK